MDQELCTVPCYDFQCSCLFATFFFEGCCLDPEQVCIILWGKCEECSILQGFQLQGTESPTGSFSSERNFLQGQPQAPEMMETGE
jgi:hypothetical protein